MFNYPSQATDETQWRCEELQTRPKQIFDIALYRKVTSKLVLNMSKILMVGSGPVAIQLARLCNLHGEHMVDMVSRVHASTKSKRVFDAYHRDGFFQ